MRNSHYYRFTWLMVLFLVANNCFAAAVPKYNGRMNNAVKGVIKTKMHKMGFVPANDPCFNATLSAVGSGVTAIAVGMAVGATWPAILIGAGINALVGFAVPLVVDKGISWLFNDNGQIITSTGPRGEILQLKIGDQEFPVTHHEGYGCTMSHKDFYSIPLYYGTMESPLRSLPVSGGFYRIGPELFGTTQLVYYDPKFSSGLSRRCMDMGSLSEYKNLSVAVCYSGVFSCQVAPPDNDKTQLNIPHPLTPWDLDFGEKPLSVDNAVAVIPETVLHYQLSAEMLATAANAMWQVAKPNQYDKFIPWSATDPITAEDAREWLVANPSLSPTVNDFIAPAVPCGLRFNSTPGAGLAKLNVAIPASEAHKKFLEQGHDRHSKPDPKPALEFAEAPDIGAPDLEDIPTAEIILAPLLNLMSDLKNFSVPSHTAVCPIASFTALGKEYQLRAHCELIEQHRALIEAAMSLAWAITALFIVLRA